MTETLSLPDDEGQVVEAPVPVAGEYLSALGASEQAILVNSLREYGCNEAEIELVCSLSLVERSVFATVLSELVAHGRSRTLLQLWEQDYLPNMRPVGITQFLEDPYYAGSVCEGFLRDCWKREMQVVLDDTSPKFEWVLRGAIGTGKTSAMVLALCRKLYLLSCLRSPQEYYGLMRGRFIVFGIFSATLKQARTAAFKQFRSYADAIPYFKEHFPRDRRADYILRFPRDILVTDGSDIMHALGQDVYGGLADEINFFRGKGGDPVRATELYDGITRRVRSRFYDRRVPFPGLFCIASSERHENDWLDKHCKELERDLSSSTAKQYHISRLSLWEATPERYSSETFRVAVGNKTVQSCVLEAGQEPPPDLLVIDVPIDFLADFKKDTEGSLRDIAGVPTWAEMPFISNVALLHEATRNPLSVSVHPFSLQIACGSECLVKAFNYAALFASSRMRQGFAGMQRFVSQPRFIHCDLSKIKDATGLAMVVPIIPAGDRTMEPTFVVEFVIKITSVMGREINYRAIRDFIRTLKRYGCPIRRVTFDQYQSVDSIQILKEYGITASTLSVDKTMEPYNALKRALLDGRLALYDYPPLVDELSTVQYDAVTDKVDHLPGKSKDVADAVAGAVYSAILYSGTLQPVARTNLRVMGAVTEPEQDELIRSLESSLADCRLREPKPIHVTTSSVRELLMSAFPALGGKMTQQLKNVPLDDMMLRSGLALCGGDVEKLARMVADDPEGLYALIVRSGRQGREQNDAIVE